MNIFKRENSGFETNYTVNREVVQVIKSGTAPALPAVPSVSPLFFHYAPHVGSKKSSVSIAICTLKNHMNAEHQSQKVVIQSIVLFLSTASFRRNFRIAS